MTIPIEPRKGATRALFAGLVTMFLGCMLVQLLFLPLLAAEAAREFPQLAYLQYPILAAAILTVGCIEVVIVATGALLAKTSRGEIFRADALRWVRVMIVAAFTAAGICAAVFAYLAFVVGAMPPPVALALIAAMVASACVGLLLIVLRSLLASAVFLTDELAGVI